jgi:hypothetical protein
MSRSIVAYDICGCTGGIHVVQPDHPEWAWEFGAKEAKAGFRVVEMDTDEWKATPLFCDAHRATHGPPWWSANRKRGSRVRRPESWPPPHPVFGVTQP